MQLVICSLGIAGNTIAILLLLGKSLRNSFNKLIAILAIFHLIYLLTILPESLRKLGLHTENHIIVSTLNSISLMCSIHVMVPVSKEQFMAVYYPLYYRSRQQDSTSNKNRVLRYVLLLLVVAVLFNILIKFFEIPAVTLNFLHFLDVTDIR